MIRNVSKNQTSQSYTTQQVLSLENGKQYEEIIPNTNHGDYYERIQSSHYDDDLDSAIRQLTSEIKSRIISLETGIPYREKNTENHQHNLNDTKRKRRGASGHDEQYLVDMHIKKLNANLSNSSDSPHD